MAIYNPEKMYEASFRDVKFLTDSVSEKGGQKTAIHEFVNSSRRKVEGLGADNATHTVVALVHGDDYVNQKKQLIKAMRRRGTGEFMHPFEGRKIVYPLNYQVVQEEKKLGQAVITLTFSEERLNPANPNALPAASSTSATDVEAASNRASEAAGDALATGFSVEQNTFNGNFEAALDTVGAIRDGFQAVVNVTNATADAITEYQGEIDAFSRDIGNLLKTPSVLASRLLGLQTSLRNLIETPQIMFDAQKGFFGRGAEVEDIPAINPIMAVRQQNQRALKTITQATSLAEQYLAVAQFDFVTSLDIQNASEDLTAQFNVLMEDTEQYITQELRELLDELNATSQAYLDNQATQTPNTFTITTEPVPLQELLFRYYGNSDKQDIIVSLNNIIDIGEVSGDILLVTEVDDDDSN